MTPTDEQVEAVAKALAWAARHPLDVSTDADDLWPHHTTESQELYLSQARAAIAAMQPSVAQVVEILDYIAKMTPDVSHSPAAEDGAPIGDDVAVIPHSTWEAIQEDCSAALRALTEPQREDTP